MQKTVNSVYNDGVVMIYREKERKTSFGAKQNVTALDDMDKLCKLDFAELSCRQRDYEFAQNAGFDLSRKIRTRRIKGIDNKCKAVIDGYLYDVSYIDKNSLELFFYLQGVRKIDP